MGRPTDYREEMNEQAYKLCLLGATDAKLADFFGVSEVTINAWKNQYPNFLKSIKAGKEDADTEVAKSLYHRALGYSHPEEKIFCSEGNIVKAQTVKRYPPDTVAAIFWLKNRAPKEWRDKIEVGGSLDVSIVDRLTAGRKRVSEQE